MNSPVLRDLFKNKIRKQILKNNKKINHKSYVRSLQWGEKIVFLMKYHKKKLLLLFVAGLLTWNYSFHKTVYHWMLGIRPPHQVILGLLIDMPDTQPTWAELSMHKITLSDQTKDILIKLYYESDKHLYFGMGRKFLFEVYSTLDMLQTDDQKKLFWQKSQFVKKRNQLAAGVGLVEHLAIFQEALKKKQQKSPQLTEIQFRDQFVQATFQVAPIIFQWEKQFNQQREKQFLKSAPGMSETKKQVVSQILKQQPQISLQQIQAKLQKMGLKGLNLADRYYFHRCQQVWLSMLQLNIQKGLSHPTIHMDYEEKSRLQSQLHSILQKRQKITQQKLLDLADYESMYQKQML